jgi:AbiU2
MGSAKPTLSEILTSLKQEVVFGRAYLNIAKGLGKADPVVLGTGQTFFGLTIEASLHMSQMYAAKLYDTTSGAITVQSLLKTARWEAKNFKYGNPQEVLAAAETAEKRISGLVTILRSVKDRRNQSLAHLDPEQSRTRLALQFVPS